MKTKLIKNGSSFYLFLDEKLINEKYGCSQQNPIMLAKLTDFADTKFYKLVDLRLTNYDGVSALLEPTSIEKYAPKNNADKEKLLSNLDTYSEINGIVYWSTFNGVVAFGDKTEHSKLPYSLKMYGEGAWSYKLGLQELKKIRDFWNEYNHSDLSDIRIYNPYQQMSLFEYQHNFPLDRKIKNR
jgi:hypothetical protein